VEPTPAWPNLPSLMFGSARRFGNRPLFRYWREGAWHSMRWPEFTQGAANLARALRQAGIVAGDRVLLVSPNRPEVAMAEVALMAIRAVPVPTYVTNTVADHAHILRDSGARVAVVADAGLAEAVRQAAPDGLDLLIAMEDVPSCLSFAALAAGTAAPDDIAAEAAMIPTDALACLIYTSGTGGAPRGVMVPHRAVLSNCRGGVERLRPLELKDDVYLSFLPASHSFEHMVGLFFLPGQGTEIVFSRGVEHLAADLAAIRPTVLTVVPRLLEVIRGRILAQVARQPGWRQYLFRRALALGLKRLDGRLGVADLPLDKLLDRLVRAKIRARFGGRLRAAVSGGARLEPEVGRFFLAMGLPVLQGYGQSEAGPAISANGPVGTRADTVGRPLDGIDLRIAADGEILVRGDCIMTGYWGRPGETAATIRDGWLHTGDIGVLDADGHLRITDRKRDIIKLSGGETLSPARIEGLLMAEPEIAQAVVAGDGEAALWALLVAAEGCDEDTVAAAVARVNRRLSVPERVRHHRCVPAFTQDNGLLTPTQKIRRAAVLYCHSQVAQV
jgi:long-chain acyl-CoA synthetase